jgi:hypothetical protein
MTEEAAGMYEWARLADITAEEAWDDLGNLADEVDWDVEQMMAAMESNPGDLPEEGAERGEVR